jgi:hypothetical protein
MSFAKIKPTEDLNELYQKLCKIGHNIADEAYPQVWLHMLGELASLGGLTGDQILTCASTLLAHFTAAFVLSMKKVIDDDDTGYDIENMLNDIFEASAKMLKSKLIKLPTSETKHEFKKININGKDNE